ncbi:MAG TPA: glycosyltransferase family 4 protein [Vicinamibacterales bacterium]|nr:glycosyltransferase family 4 protein [Vicinamibacterales bacterium]
MTAGRLPDQVLLLTPDLHGADGVSCVARQLARGLAGAVPDRPLDIWVLANERRTDLVEDDVPGSIRSADGHRARLIGWVLRRAATDCRRLLVIAAHARLAPLALPLVMRGARLAIYLHGVEVWRPLSRLETLAFRRAAVLMANSRYTITTFQMTNPAFARSAVAICPPGVTPRAPGSGRPDAATGAPTVLTVGRLWAEERYKGHDLLLDIWPDVLEAVPGARLLIVGDGDDRPRLESRAAASPWRGSVTLLGRVPRRDLEQLYADCDLFVMPSAREGFGLVFLEAMAAGRPCIGAHGAASEIVVPDVTGLLVDAQDRQGLLRAIVDLLGDPDLRRRMGEAGAGRVVSRFTERHFHACLRSALGLPAPSLPVSDPARAGGVP